MISILLAKRIDLEDRVVGGQTALFMAAREGHEKAVRLLLQKGANINFQWDQSGDTAVHLVTRRRQTELLRLLLKHEPDLSITNKENLTALDIAVQQDHQSVVRLFVQNSVHYNLVHTFVQLAAMPMTAIGTLSALVRGGLDPSVTSQSGSTALHIAAEYNRLENVTFLMTVGADPCIQDSSGDTALHIAAKRGFMPVVDQLVKHMSNLELRNDAGQTASQVAAESRWGLPGRGDRQGF